MSNPTQATTHIDAPLTNISVAYLQSENNFIATKVFPDVGVAKRSDKYFVFDKASFMRDSMEKRGSGEQSAGTGYKVSNDTFYCDIWALHKDIFDPDRAQTDSPLDQDRNATQLLSQAALIRKEKQWTTDYFTTGVWETDNTSATQWSNYLTSDPLGDIDVAKETMLTSTGREPNTLVLGLQVFNRLKNHPDVIDRIKYTSSRVVTEEVLATLFGVGRVLVPKGISVAGAEGKTVAPALIHGKHALLLHVAANPGVEVPSAGYTFNWTGLAPGFSNQGVTVSKFRMNELNGDRIEIQAAFDQKVVCPDLGYFFSSVVA